MIKIQLLKLQAILLLTIALLFSGNSMAQQKKNQTIEIQSSVVCGMCEKRVIENMAFEKGVKKIKVDLETKIVTITFNTEKTDKEKLKKALTKIGYDADELAANEKAYQKLPPCCKKDAPPH